MRIRVGTTEDAAGVLALGDEAVAWMNARGNNQQWGVEPWTGDERRESFVRAHAAEGLRVLVDESGAIAGALVITETCQDYIPAAEEPELYLNLLLTSRRHSGRGLGGLLIERAVTEATARGIDLLRVDCYAGGDGKLVRVYENYGFTRVAEFAVGPWPGMLLARRLSTRRQP